MSPGTLRQRRGGGQFKVLAEDEEVTGSRGEPSGTSNIPSPRSTANSGVRTTAAPSTGVPMARCSSHAGARNVPSSNSPSAPTRI